MTRSSDQSSSLSSNASSDEYYTPPRERVERFRQARTRRRRRGGRGGRIQGRGVQGRIQGRGVQGRGVQTRGGFQPQGIRAQSGMYMEAVGEEEGRRGQVQRGRGWIVERHEEEEEAAAIMITLRPGIGNSCATNSNGRPGLDNSCATSSPERREIGNSQATNCIVFGSPIMQPQINEGGTRSGNTSIPNPQGGPEIGNSQATNCTGVGSAAIQSQINEGGTKGRNIEIPNPQEGPEIGNPQATNCSGVGSAIGQTQIIEEGTRSSNTPSFDITSMLDCRFCFKPFSIPVSQCVKGHPACSSCCSNNNNDCPSCFSPIIDTPCLLMHELLERVKVPCLNSKYGCKEILSYGMKCEHERSCAYEACYCPLPGCDFDASCKDLYRHFAREHQASATHFAFDSPFLVHLSEDMKFIFLQERDHTLFILNYSVQNNGNVANIICVGPSCLQNEYSHKLAASSANGGIKVTYSSTQSLTKWMVCIPKNSALVVPKELIDSSQHQQIKVCIRRKR